MNKKVSTLLTVAMMLGGSLLSSSAFAQTYKAFNSVDEKKFDGKTKLYLSIDGDAGTNLMMYDESSVKVGTDKTKALWTISMTVTGGTKYYVFKNATNGKTLMFDADGNYTEETGETNLSTEYTVEEISSDYNVKVKKSDGTVYTLDNSSSTIKMSTTATSAVDLGVAVPEAAKVTNTVLNTLAGDHFSLTFPDLKNLQGNVFANELVALTVKSDVTGYKLGTDEVLFALKSSVPSSVLKGTDGVTKYEIPNKTVFDGIKFVVLNPAEKAKVSSSDAFTFKTIEGRYLLPTSAEVTDKAAGKVFVKNGFFKVQEEAINNKGEYVVSLASVYTEKEDGTWENKTDLYVNALRGGDNYYVTTQKSVDGIPADLEAFKAGTTIYATAADVLKVKAISVVNIYNMTDEDGAPYGKALSNITDDTNKKAEWVAPKDLQLDAPEGQWIITSKDGKFTFANRENGKKYENVSLFKTDDANVYTAQLDNEEVLNGQTIKLVYKTVTATDGFAVLDSEDLDTYTYNVGFNAPQFNSPFFITNGTEGIKCDQDETKALDFSITKYANSADENVLNVTDTIYSVQEYSFINDKKEVENKKDTLKVLAYTFNLTDAAGDKYYLAYKTSSFSLEKGEVADVRENGNESSIRVVLKNAAAGYTAYTLDAEKLIEADKLTDDNILKLGNILGMTSSGDLTLTAGANDIKTMVIEKVLPGTSLDMTNGHVKFAAQGGGYFALNEKNEGVMAQTVLKAAATEEDLTFYLDTVDAEALVPSFYITKGVKAEAETKAAEATRLYMYHPAADSLKTFNAAEAKYELNENYAVGTLEDHVAKVVFREAARNGNTIELTQNGEKVTVAAKAEGDVLGGVNDFRFQIVQAGDEEGVYYIKSGNNYVSNKNNVLVYTNEKSAQAVVVEASEAPTSNEGVSATEVKVVAQDGAVVVKNAAGKNVVVSTILGQVVANEVLTSDNATINVPAGIVVVAVEGESFKVNVK